MVGPKGRGKRSDSNSEGQATAGQEIAPAQHPLELDSTQLESAILMLRTPKLMQHVS